MGSIRKRNGKYQAQVRREGVKSLNRSFYAKKDAIIWVRAVEARIDAGDTDILAPKITKLADVVRRYQQEITPHKKGAPQEQRRLNRLLKDPISQVPLRKLTSKTLAQFRDNRIHDGLRAAQYDLVLIRHMLKIATKEWGITMPINPVDQITVPNGIKRRERRLQIGEWQLMEEASCACKNPYTWPMIKFAVETAMRRSEILNLKWNDIDTTLQIASLCNTKNGDNRQVPLSREALHILQTLPLRDKVIFDTSDLAIRQSWDRLMRRAGIEDLKFHDLRHEAISRFFELGLSTQEVALISGHRDPRMLARYTHLKAQNVAAKLQRLLQ